MQNTVLIVIDVQRAFDDPRWGLRNNPQAEANIAVLLAHWRAKGWPLVHVHHHSRSPEGLFNAHGALAKPEAMPQAGEPIFCKGVNSAFIGTGLEQHLRAIGAQAVVIVGITTDHCVSTTARMAGNLDFETYLVADATATFERSGHDGRHYSAQLMHDTALASVNGEFAAVLDTAALLQQM